MRCTRPTKGVAADVGLAVLFALLGCGRCGRAWFFVHLAIGQRMTRYDSKHDQRGAHIFNRERPRTSKEKSADSDTPHIIAKRLQQFPSISDNVTARYFERAPRTVHQLQAPVILSFLSCNLPRCCSAGRIFSRFVPTLFPFWCCFFFFLGGATLQNISYTCPPLRLLMGRPKLSCICASRGIMRQIHMSQHVPTRPNHLPWKIQWLTVIQMGETRGNIWIIMDTYGTCGLGIPWFPVPSFPYF